MKAFTYLLGFGLAFALSAVHAEDEKPKNPIAWQRVTKTPRAKKAKSVKTL